jgi:hypothetical protein
MLTDRVLAYEFHHDRLLFRAAHQTVVHVTELGPRPGWYIPPDPTGRSALLERATPRGSGPMRLRLPTEPVAIIDDAGYGCAKSEAVPMHARC